MTSWTAYQEVGVPSLDAILDRRVFDLSNSMTEFQIDTQACDARGGTMLFNEKGRLVIW